MKYFFKDENDQYFNPLNGENELYGFDLETIEIKQYTHWLDDKLPQVKENDMVASFDLSKWTIQFLDVIFLCILKADNGLYLSLNYQLSSIPFIWNFRPCKQTKNKLFIANHFHPHYSLLSFTNQANNLEDDYKLNKYVKYHPGLTKRKFQDVFYSLDKIHTITHLFKLTNKTPFNNIIQKEGKLNLCDENIDLDKHNDVQDFFSFECNYENQYYDSCFAYGMLICGTNEIYLELDHKRIPRNKLKGFKLSNIK
jgi:hypothetical protein